MNATERFIAGIYDTLAQNFGFDKAPAGLFFQMAWPAIAINSSDYKNETGSYDKNIAQELFSDIADIEPLFSKIKFEDSANRIEDLYEILIACARPAMLNAPENIGSNPMFKLFADEQYGFVNSIKGSVTEPNSFYHPCKATPANWYEEEASQSWPEIKINSGNSTQPDQTSFFIRNKGMELIEKGIWTVLPEDKTLESIDNMVDSKVKMDDLKTGNSWNFYTKQNIARPVKEKIDYSNSLKLSPFINDMNKWASPLSQKIVETSISLNNAGEFSENDLFTNAFQKEFSKQVTSNTTEFLFPQTSYQKHPEWLKEAGYPVYDPNAPLIKKIPFRKRLLLDNLVFANMSTLPASSDTEEFSISFNYCRVNIERPWLNMSLLSMPNWYMYGYKANAYSNGSVDNNTGIFSLLTTSFIVVRNLKISAKWSDYDLNNFVNGFSFGPFDIRFGQMINNTFEIPGMHIIAFTSRVTPSLAPIDSI